MNSKKIRKLIAADGKRDRRLWEIATLAVLRERLRSGDVWVEGGRAFCPLETQLVPIPDFAARKAAGDLVPSELAPASITRARIGGRTPSGGL